MKKNVGSCFFAAFVCLTLLIIYSVANAENATYQASFDCSKAHADIEKLICSNRSIAGLDLLLNNVYASRLGLTPKEKQDQFKQTQKAWLRKRNECIGLLPAEEYFCVLEEYRFRIRELGGIQQLISFYKESCAKDEWDCEAAGDLELSIGNLSEAIKYYSILCDADHDGDAGGNCYKKASVLEKMRKISEAKALYNKTCQNRNNNDACGAALRLGPQLSPLDHWSGLYRNESGSLFISMKDNGKFTVNMDTHWANGHTCSFLGKGFIENDRATIEVDPDDECKPEITRTGNVISIRDPTDKCRPTWCGTRGNFEGDFARE